MGLLPTTRTVKKSNNPRNLIMFGLPKAGKTTALAQLPGCLIIDLENGSDYIEGAFVMKANNYVELFKIAKALSPTWKGEKNDKYEPHDFKFVAIDTVTALEDMALDLAAKRYSEAPVGKNWTGTGKDILKLPMGAGYFWLKEAVLEILGWFNQIENLILVGHVKDKQLTEGGIDLNVKMLNLTGSLSSKLASESDGMCYLYRDPETGNLMANFGDMNSVLTGSRLQNLAGKTILLAERVQLDNGNFDIKTHWENIYPSLNEA